MTSPPSAQQLALACGVAGAYVDVTDDLVTDPISGSWGRTSGFTDTRPGVLSFDLVNDTGKYTPGNTGSSLATTVSVGMGVHHIVDGMHFAGTIRSAEPYFTGPASLSGSSKIRVTCDDLLGNAARRTMGDLSESTFTSGGPLMLWPLTDAAGSSSAVETWHGDAPSFYTGSPGITLGVTSSHIPGAVVQQDSALSAGMSAGTTWPYFDYGTTTLGAWGFWVERNNVSADFAFTFQSVGLTLNSNIRSLTGNITMRPGLGTRIIGPAMPANTPFYCAVSTATTFAAGVWTITMTLYVNGVNYGSADYVQTTPATVTSLNPAERQIYSMIALQTVTGTGDIYYSRLAHTLNPINEYYAQVGTADMRLYAIANVVPELTLDTVPTMSPTILAMNDTSGQSALDAFNDVIRTEQGYIWAETTGTILAPDQKVKVLGRDRPATVDAAHTFTISEIENAPEFTTDIENMVSYVSVRGPDTDVFVTDTTLIPYVGSASDSATVLLRDSIDLTAWGQDRLLRGAATDVRVPRITLDALKINRWADVSALRAGDRVRISGLPTTQLGVSYIDGWLIGGSYNLRYPALHGENQMLFTFYMQPVLADTAIFDTNRFMSGGEMTVNTTFDSSVTSISIASTGDLFTTSTDLPTTIRIGGEVLTVTAASGASSPQTFTVARGATDPLTGLATTAAGHTAGDLVEIATPSLFAF